MDSSNDPFLRGRVEADDNDGISRTIMRPSPMASTAQRTETKKGRVAVLASGRGSNFQAMIDAIERGEVSYYISILICNNPDAFVIERAKKHSIPYVVIDHRGKER